jgi:integral membrane protein (TIGR01906 family)
MPSVGAIKEHGQRKAGPLDYLLGAALIVGLLGLIVLYSTQAVALDIDFYREGWAASDVPSKTGMPLDELTRAGVSLMDYFRGRLDSPQIEAEIRSIARPLYNEKELAHLVDVRDLFAKGFLAHKVCWLLTILPAAYLVLRRDRRALGKSMAISGATGIGVLALLAIPAAMNFTGWWTKFHLLSFTNDLWLLDPKTDWLINKFTEDFFFRAVTAIGHRSLVVSALLLAAGLLIRYLASDHRH